MSDENYVCARCLCLIPAGDEERVGLVLYCPGCAEEYQDDEDIKAMLESAGAHPSC